MSHASFEPMADAPPLTKERALQFFIDGCTHKAEHRIGTEAEFMLVDAKELSMCSYEQVAKFLHALAERGEWSCEYDDEHIIALKRGSTVIALEPGGQLEYASAPFVDVHELQNDAQALYADLRVLCEQFACNLLSMGMHPLEDWDAIPLIPKKRYGIMAPRLERMGPMARSMMRGSSGWQCAVDYEDEANFTERFSTFFHVTSLITAIYANSPWKQGRFNHFASTRLAAWMQTDPARCGLIEDVYSGSFGFEAYYEFALRVPMLFIMRDGTWIDVGCTFAEFMQRGADGHYATYEDWILHLSTIFPEARLKNFIEVRCADANRFDWLESFPALILGLLEESSLMAAARDVTKHLSFSQRLDLHAEVARWGLGARVGNIGAHELAGELVAIAREGLARRGRDEGAFLDPICDYGRNYRVPQWSDHVSSDDLAPYLLLS